MPNQLELTDGDRELFGFVHRAVFSNPFGVERAELDRKMAGLAEGAEYAATLAGSVEAVGRSLSLLEQGGLTELGRYGEEDALLLKMAILFSLFHESLRKFDDLIERQVKGGGTLQALFCRDIVEKLVERGIDRESALWFVAAFYQLRRAYYFIRIAGAGDSPCMMKFRGSLWTSIFTHDTRLYDLCMWDRMEDFSTLLLGETGTGKGMAAMAIGRSGYIPYDFEKGQFESSFMETFISLNLSQFQESLIESELFGHRKGAFTGAVDHHDGVLSRCVRNGAIFLDEIGDVSIPVQIKLLQVLQERTFSPVGSHERKRFNGRVIAATNKPLGELRESGLFRDDFYYRLCSDEITVPPLRQRIRESDNELPALTANILGRLVGDCAMADRVVETLMTDLGREYDWPGNVRELEQAIRRIMLTGEYKGDSKDARGLEQEVCEGVKNAAFEAKELVAAYCELLYSQYGTYEDVSQRTGLDWRTVKKYIKDRTK